ncbi:MAG TPA: hypothetical protein V6C78_20220 [Crinalium sp.]|jgi:hypothetical protein
MPFKTNSLLVKATLLSSSLTVMAGATIALATLFSAVSAIVYKQIKARLSFMGIYAIAFLSMAVGYFVISVSPTYGMVLVGLMNAVMQFIT